MFLSHYEGRADLRANPWMEMEQPMLEGAFNGVGQRR
jgi:hypothetical protein